jgi:hypothetical protein
MLGLLSNARVAPEATVSPLIDAAETSKSTFLPEGIVTAPPVLPYKADHRSNWLVEEQLVGCE